MNLTGTPIGAAEAASYGLVAKVFPPETLVDEAVKTADKIASHSKIIVQVNLKSVCIRSFFNFFILDLQGIYKCCL